MILERGHKNNPFDSQQASDSADGAQSSSLEGTGSPEASEKPSRQDRACISREGKSTGGSRRNQPLSEQVRQDLEANRVAGPLQEEPHEARSDRSRHSQTLQARPLDPRPSLAPVQPIPPEP